MDAFRVRHCVMVCMLTKTVAPSWVARKSVIRTAGGKGWFVCPVAHTQPPMAVLLVGTDMTAMLLAGFCLGIATLWIFLELLALIMRRRAPPVTLHHRKHRDAAERRLSREGRDNEDRVCYQFMGATGHEEE